MYRCQQCHSLVGPRTRQHKVVAERRPANFKLRLKVHRYIWWDGSGKRHKLMHDDPGGAGKQIVREIAICPQCFAQRAEA